MNVAGNRVGGAVAGPAPHTTRRAGPHRAVRRAASTGDDPAAKVRGRSGAETVTDPFPRSRRASPTAPRARARSCLTTGLMASRTSPWCLVARLFGPSLCLPARVRVLWPLLTSAAPSRPVAGSVARSWQLGRSPVISTHSFAPRLPDLPRADLGNHGFRCLVPAHPSLVAFYPVSVRQVVAVAPASFRPHLAVTPLPSLNGPDSLDRRGLSPPRTDACTAYTKVRLADARGKEACRLQAESV